MSRMTLLPENRNNVALFISAILLTIISFVIISISLQAAYLWFIILLMMILFMTTFTCSNAQHVMRRTGRDENFVEVTSPNNNQATPPWVIDLPPSYTNVTGLPTGETPPPSYRKLNFLPLMKREPAVNVVNNHLSSHARRMHTTNEPPAECSNKTVARQMSESSVQTLNFSVIEDQ